MSMELLSQIFEVCIIPLLGVLTTFLIKWINSQMEKIKINTKNETEAKYISMLNDTITSCVIATCQTYVDSLKKQNAFDTEAQKEAFSRTYEAVLKLLTEEATEYLNEAIGDLELYIQQRIESEVKANKTTITE